jgi:two-component system sensor histidine kinase AlgZ
MHPIFASRNGLALYLTAWGVQALLLAGLLRLDGDLDFKMALELATPLALVYAFVCLTPWYGCRTLPLGKTSNAKIVLNHFGATVFATALWVGAARVLGYFLDFDRRSLEMPLLIAVGFFLYGLSIALHYTWLAIEASRDAVVQAREAELRALKAQVNPHFLFNSLNSIAALASTDPARAREMCIHLSGFLRQTLGLGEKASISWGEEVQLARTYLDVEQIRFGKRLRVEMHMDEGCAHCQVPPLVLQPLIENAVKHGIASMVDGGTIRVDSKLENGTMLVSVENSFDPDSPSPRSSGLGIRNVRSRLETRFGSAGQLSVNAENSVFRAQMSVPYRKMN